jgi:mannosyl-oligosaccharide alpha-1,2-mannosidase
VQFAWDGYVARAWGSNEVNPVAGVPNDSLYQGASMGATILDSLDTLLVMGLIDEYRKARQWIKDSLRYAAYRAGGERRVEWSTARGCGFGSEW